MYIFYNTVLFSTWIIYAQVDAQIEDVNINPIKTDVDVWLQRNARVAVATNEHLECEKPSVYTCEEPLDTAPVYSNKVCNYRNVQYHEQVYKWVAGRGCLVYTPDFLYVDGRNPINLNAFCMYGDLFAPCLEIAKEDGSCGCFPFDPAFEEVATIVRNATLPSAHGRWEKCYYEASDCCNHYMENSAILTTSTDLAQCSTTFDGWTCWDSTAAGTVASAVCSEFAYSNTGPTCHHFSTKECYGNGTWELVTDYTTCSVTPRLLRRYWLHIGVLACSIAACVPAVFIFFFYKRLRVTRVALHRNLLIAIIVRNALVISSRSRIYIDELTSVEDTVMSTNGSWCRMLAVLERAAASTVFVCMLVEGIYLHRLIVATFRHQLKVVWLYGLGAIIVVLPVTAWAVVMSIYNDHSCWMVYTVPHIQWILDVPRIAILLINMVLFIDVIRVLLTKIRNSENAYQLSTTKATLFLMPLFGVQFIFTAFRPSTFNCITEQVYYYVAYTVEGLQGLLVATLYCYVNMEVHLLIKATYKKTEMAFTSRIRGSLSAGASVDPNDRRLTYSTNLPTNHEDEHKDHNLKPKYVAEIISIQASERLAEILDPIYETIDPGVTNEGFMDRADLDNDSGFIPNRSSKEDDYYGFTNVSSVSIGCRDWLKDTPSYNGSGNTAVGYYLPCFNQSINKNENIGTSIENNVEYVDMEAKNDNNNVNEVNVELIEEANKNNTDFKPSYKDCDNMLDEIMQCIEIKENDDVNPNPEHFVPKGPEEENIVFVND